MIDFQAIDVGRVLLAVLLNFVWQATLVAGLVYLLKTLAGPRLVRVQYGLSVLGLLALVMFPTLSFGYYIVEYDHLPAIAIGVEGLTVAAQSGIESSGSGVEALESLFLWFDSARHWWLGIWLFGAAALAGRMMISLFACHQVRKHTSTLPGNVDQIVARIKKNLNLGANVSVVVSTRIAQAVATGILKPMVLLPAAWLTEMPIASLEAVIAHELAHIKRYDLWLVAIQRCVETVFFFHPATWWISRRLTQEREACCDRLAVQVTGNKLQYAETLAMIAKANNLDNQSLTFCSAFSGGQKMNLLRRITLVLEPTHPGHRTPMRPLASIACLALMVALGSYSYNVSASPVGISGTKIQDEDADQDVKKVKKYRIVKKEKVTRKKVTDKKEEGVYRVLVSGDGNQEGEFAYELHWSADGPNEFHLLGDDEDAPHGKHKFHIIGDQEGAHAEYKLHVVGDDADDAPHGKHKLYIIGNQENLHAEHNLHVEGDDGTPNAVHKYFMAGDKGVLHAKQGLNVLKSKDGGKGGIWIVADENGNHSVKQFKMLHGDHAKHAIVIDRLTDSEGDGKPHIIRLELHEDGDGEKHSEASHSWKIDSAGEKHHEAGALLELKALAGEQDGIIEILVEMDDEGSDHSAKKLHADGKHAVMQWRLKGDDLKKLHEVEGGFMKKGNNVFLFKDGTHGAHDKLIKKNKNVILHRQGDDVAKGKRIELKLGNKPAKNALRNPAKNALGFFHTKDEAPQSDRQVIRGNVIRKNKVDSSTKDALAEVLAEIKKLRREVNRLKKDAASDK